MTETVTVKNIVNIYGECSVNVREFESISTPMALTVSLTSIT